jgi:hypothetical protein
MVSVLAIGPKVRGFKPGCGGEFSREIKILRLLSFRGAIKPEASCRKILRHVINHLQLRIKIIRKTIFIIPFARSPCLLPDDCW